VDVREETLSGLPLLIVSGHVDHLTAPVLEGAVTRALRESESRMLLDLTDCGYLDSAALSVLIHALREVQGRGWLGVINPDANLTRLFEIVGLTASEWFRIFPGVEQASAAVVE
jgi:anti-anti-sigma factor